MEDVRMKRDNSTEFVSLLARHERELALYVYGLVARQADAEDILQQTKMVMWKAFADFVPDTNFLAWSRKIAFHQILGYRRKSKREHLPLNDEMLATLGEKITELTDYEHARRESLSSCLARLQNEQRTMILLRYNDELEVDEIAKKINSTSGAVYRALSRLRITLMDCVRSRMENLQKNSI